MSSCALMSSGENCRYVLVIGVILKTSGVRNVNVDNRNIKLFLIEIEGVFLFKKNNSDKEMNF